MTNEQKLFIEQWNEKYEESIECINLVKIRAENAVFEQLPLFTNAKKEIWGLLLLGKKIHCYFPAAESSMAMLFRSASGKKPPQDQYLCLSDFTLQAVIPPKKKSFLHLLCKSDETVAVRFKNPQTSADFTLFLDFHAFSNAVIEKLQTYISQ